MRIAILIAKFEPGGLAVVNSQLLLGLTKKGHDVSLVSATVNPGTHMVMSEGLITLEAKSSFRSVFSIRSKMFQGEYDIVIVSQLFLGLIALLARPRQSSTSLMVVEHSSLEYWRDSPKMKDRIVLRLSRQILGRVDQIASVSEEGTSSINQQFRRMKRIAEYLPNPVLNGDESVFKGDPIETVGRSGIVLLGRLEREKRVTDVIRAFALISSEVSEGLTILGDGSEMGKCVDLVTELGLNHRVYFKGFVENVKEYFEKSKCLVLASSHEGLAIVLIEALASGCQVVSTDCPSGPKEVLKDGKYGKLIEIGDIEGLSHAMKSALQVSSNREGLAHHLSQFTTDNSAVAYEKLCLETISIRKKLISK